MASSRDLAKRALVALIKFLAGIYSLTVDVKRESPDEEVRKAYRRERERERTREREREREGERARERERDREKEGACERVSLWAALWRGQHLAKLLPRDNSSFGISELFFCENSHPLKSRMGSANRFTPSPLRILTDFSSGPAFGGPGINYPILLH